MLRMLAIATALLTGGGGLAIEPGAQERAGALMLVIEELENGLHPSQAAALLRLIGQQATAQGFQVVLTTHSPALLDALSGEQHRGVIVIQRDRTSGVSTAERLVDLPGYVRLLSATPLGAAVTAGRPQSPARAAGRRRRTARLGGQRESCRRRRGRLPVLRHRTGGGCGSRRTDGTGVTGLLSRGPVPAL